jgi:hypothetical protein
MKTIFTMLLAAAGVLLAQPQFTAQGELTLPANYREWVFLSSGLGMTYGPSGEASGDRTPRFDNVFVNPAAYQAFLATGKWPEKTMLVLEVRTAVSKGSINNGGHYQGDAIEVAAEVKDSSRFPTGGWAFFTFENSKTAAMMPRTEACYACHSQKGAVDNTFVQFYPTLLAIAKQKGTLTRAYTASPDKH